MTGVRREPLEWGEMSSTCDDETDYTVQRQKLDFVLSLTTFVTSLFEGSTAPAEVILKAILTRITPWPDSSTNRHLDLQSRW